MAKKKIHVLSNTHWDREHRHGFEETRIMLVEMMDKLLDIMENNPDFKYYTLDGQSIMLDDYLEIKPQNRDRLAKLIEQGRILIGPWYSLVDAFSANPEGVVRNLLIGDRLCKQFGKPMKFGYSIFSFGQMAQLPQVYAGFGIHDIIFYKGYSAEVFKTPEFIWKSPDGTKALTSRLSKFHRVNFFVHFTVPVILGGNMLIPGWKVTFDNGGRVAHPVDSHFYHQHARELEPDILIRKENITRAVQDFLEEVSVSNAKKTFLGFDGIDFSAPLAEMPEAIKLANEMTGDDVELVQSTILDYINEFREEVDLEGLTEYEGEMRFGPVWKVHTESMSANVDIKQRLRETEVTTLFFAEPYSVFGQIEGALEYPRDFLLKTWKYIMGVYCHDSAHGLGVPKIKSDSLNRLEQAQEIADGLAARAMYGIVSAVDTSGAGDDDIMITLFNPLPYRRSETVDLVIDLPREERVEKYWLEETDGSKIDHYQNSRYHKNIASVNNENRPKSLFCDRVEISAYVKDIPPTGYKTLQLRRIKGDPLAPEMPFPAPKFQYKPIGKRPDLLDNGILRIEIATNGSLSVTDLETGYKTSGLNTLNDAACSGDTWIHREPERIKTITTAGCNAEISTVRNSGLSATSRVELNLDIPQSLTQDRKARSGNTIPVKIVSEITLNKDSRRVDIKTSLNNLCKDHMLTACFPTGIKAENSYSECPFEIRERLIDNETDNDGIRGDELVRYAMRKFVSVSDGINGFTLMTRGLHEFEAASNEGAVLTLTLLRAVTQTFPVHEDVFLSYENELSQCIGGHCFEYSLYIHPGDYKVGGAIRQSRLYNVPVSAVQFGKGKAGTLPMSLSFLELSNPLTVLNCVKLAEDDSDVVIRLTNPTDEKIRETLTFYKPIKRARLVNINEEPLEEMKVKDGNTIEIEIPPFKIITLRFTV